MKNRDPFLNDFTAIHRLMNEYHRHNKLIVAYDFDNTVYDFHKKGYTFERVVKLLRRAHELGCYLIVYSCSDSSRYDFIRSYLDENEIPFDTINENCPDTNFSGGKLYYNILLDDRAGLSSAYNILSEVVFNLELLNVKGREKNEK